jgi:hypothetical protein
LQRVNLLRSIIDFEVSKSPVYGHVDIITLMAAVGLLHDGSEAYLRDIPNPIKNIPEFGEAYKKLEAKVQTAIEKKFLSSIIEKPIFNTAKACTHWADAYALQVEAAQLVVSGGQHWRLPFKLTKEQLDCELDFESTRSDQMIGFRTMYKRLTHA